MKDAATVTKSRRLQFFALIRKKMTLLIAALVTSCAIMIFNSLYLASSLLGVSSAMVFLVSLGTVCGMSFFEEDPSVLKVVKGAFTLVMILTIIGSLLLYLGVFNLLASMVMIVLVAGLFLGLQTKKLRSSSEIAKLKVERIQHPRPRIYEISVSVFLNVIVFASFYILLTSRTLKPMFDVWYTIPLAVFLFLIFLSVLALISLIFFGKSSYLHLALIVFVGFLFVSLYYIVWYPSLYGDPLSQLGAARYANRTGSIYAINYLLSQGFWTDIIKYQGYYSLVVLLSRLLSFDIYWVHNISIPFLWSIILPFSTYEVTCVLLSKPSREFPREAILAALGTLLIPDLIIWGADPTPNTLAFLFLFFTIALILRWATTGGKIILGLAVLGTTTTLMTHPMPGIFAVVFLLVAAIFRKVKWILPKTLAIVGSTLLYPLVLRFERVQFELGNLFSIENFVDFEGVLITVPLLVATIGFFLYLRQKNVNRRIAPLILAFYVLVVIEYYITKFGVVVGLYGPGRVLTISNFLLTPFIGFCFSLLPEVVVESRKLQGAFVSKMSQVYSSLNVKTVVSVVLCLLISFQSVVALYQAYPKGEVGIAPTEYEMQAVYYLNSTAPRRFVVLSDVLFANLAIGLLGQDYSYIGIQSGGGFGIPEWNYRVQELYVELVNDMRAGATMEPSLEKLETAMRFALAQVAYFVVSERLTDFEDVVFKTSQILQVDKVFGQGKLYLFKYPVPIMEGNGPNVTVIYDEGAAVEEVQSKFSYSVQAKVSYSVRLTGYTSYNITDYPKNWIFESLTVSFSPAPFDNSSDINSFIYIKGLNRFQFVDIRWSANDNFPVCAFKEDSFKAGWGPYPEYGYKIKPMIMSDGNVLTLSGNFTQDGVQDYYYAKPVNISTDDYPYLIIKWKSTDTIAVSAVYFESGVQIIVPFGGYSLSWTTTIVQLSPGKTINYIMVGISNYRPPPQPVEPISGVNGIYVDYILVCAEKTP